MIEIVQLVNKEKEEGIKLAKKIYTENRDESYTDEGVKTFYEFLDNTKIMNSFKTYGALVDGVLSGVIATDKSRRHINLFFVEKTYQGQGIGKLLMNKVLELAKGSYITVNSSRYAVPIYKKFGFEATAEEQQKDGLIFTPMKKILEEK